MQRPILFAFFIVTLDAMGAGLIFPVLPELLSRIFEVPAQSNIVTQAGAALFILFAVLMFFFGPIIGSLSDRFGRRYILAIAMAFMVIDYILMALFPLFWVLLIGRAIAAIAGGSYTAAFAIVGDVSDKKNRGQNFGIVSSGLGLGFILGPLIGGWVGSIHIALPFWFAAGLAGLAVVFSLTMFTETLPPRQRRTFSLREANAFAVFSRIRKNHAIKGILLALLIFSCGESIYESIWSYYGTAAFGWTAWDIGLTLMIFGVGMTAVQGGLAGPSIRWFGALRVAIGSMALSCVGLFLMTFAWATWMIYALMPLMWATALTLPALQTHLSEQIDANRQGELQGVIASIGSFSLIVAGIYGYASLLLGTWENGLIYLPGLPFGIACALCSMAWGLFWRATRTVAIN